MDSQTLYIIIGVTAVIMLIAGIGIGSLIFRTKAKREEEKAQQESKRIISDAAQQADTLKKTKLLEAKEDILKLKTEYERESIQKSKAAEQAEQRIRSREQSLNQKTESAQRKEQELDVIKQNLDSNDYFASS